MRSLPTALVGSDLMWCCPRVPASRRHHVPRLSCGCCSCDRRVDESAVYRSRTSDCSRCFRSTECAAPSALSLFPLSSPFPMRLCSAVRETPIAFGGNDGITRCRSGWRGFALLIAGFHFFGWHGVEDSCNSCSSLRPVARIARMIVEALLARHCSAPACSFSRSMFRSWPRGRWKQVQHRVQFLFDASAMHVQYTCDT